MQINILGQVYTITKNIDPNKDNLSYECGAYCNPRAKKIVVFDLRKFPINDGASPEDFPSLENLLLRHEIIHAFLFESGLDSNTYSDKAWAENEEIVDWFAIQSPKIYKAFEKAGCL